MEETQRKLLQNLLSVLIKATLTEKVSGKKPLYPIIICSCSEVLKVNPQCMNDLAPCITI